MINPTYNLLSHKHFIVKLLLAFLITLFMLAISNLNTQFVLLLILVQVILIASLINIKKSFIGFTLSLCVSIALAQPPVPPCDICFEESDEELVFDFTGTTSGGLAGDPDNSVVTICNPNLANASIDLFSADDFDLDPIGLSWCSEVVLVILDINGAGIDYTPAPGETNQGPCMNGYTTGGDVSLASLGIAPLILDPGGCITIEVTDNFDDGPGVDANVTSGTIVLSQIICVASECPVFALPSGELDVIVTNSTCDADGLIEPPANMCPAESTLLYSLDNFATMGTTTPPTYDPDNVQTISTRCVCDCDDTNFSETSMVVTEPDNICCEYEICEIVTSTSGIIAPPAGFNPDLTQIYILVDGSGVIRQIDDTNPNDVDFDLSLVFPLNPCFVYSVNYDPSNPDAIMTIDNATNLSDLETTTGCNCIDVSDTPCQIIKTPAPNPIWDAAIVCCDEAPILLSAGCDAVVDPSITNTLGIEYGTGPMADPDACTAGGVNFDPTGLWTGDGVFCVNNPDGDLTTDDSYCYFDPMIDGSGGPGTGSPILDEGEISVLYTVGEGPCVISHLQDFFVFCEEPVISDDITICCSPSGNYPLTGLIATGTGAMMADETTSCDLGGFTFDGIGTAVFGSCTPTTCAGTITGEMVTITVEDFETLGGSWASEVVFTIAHPDNVTIDVFTGLGLGLPTGPFGPMDISFTFVGTNTAGPYTISIAETFDDGGDDHTFTNLNIETSYTCTDVNQGPPPSNTVFTIVGSSPGFIGSIFGNVLNYDPNQDKPASVTIEYNYGDDLNGDGDFTNDGNCAGTGQVTIDILENFNVSLDIPESVCQEGAIDFSDFLVITDSNGDVVDPTTVNGSFSIIKYTDPTGTTITDNPTDPGDGDPLGNGAGNADAGILSPTGIYLPGNGGGTIAVQYQIIVENPDGFDCISNDVQVFNVSQPIDFNAQCLCTQDPMQPIVDIGPISGGVAPYTVNISGGGDISGLDPDGDGSYTIATMGDDGGEFILFGGTNAWSVTIIDSRGCQQFISGECDIPALDIDGLQTESCASDPTHQIFSNIEVTNTVSLIEEDIDVSAGFQATGGIDPLFGDDGAELQFDIPIPTNLPEGCDPADVTITDVAIDFTYTFNDLGGAGNMDFTIFAIAGGVPTFLTSGNTGTVAVTGTLGAQAPGTTVEFWVQANAFGQTPGVDFEVILENATIDVSYDCIINDDPPSWTVTSLCDMSDVTADFLDLTDPFNPIFDPGGLGVDAGGQFVVQMCEQYGLSGGLTASANLAIDPLTGLEIPGVFVEDPCYQAVIADDCFCEFASWDGFCQTAFDTGVGFFGPITGCPNSFFDANDPTTWAEQFQVLDKTCEICTDEVFKIYPEFDPEFTIPDLVCETDMSVTICPEDITDILATFAGLECVFDRPGNVVEANEFIDWSGPGITQLNDGTGCATFNPMTAGAGVHAINLSVGYTTCEATFVGNINVKPAVDANIEDRTFCASTSQNISLSSLFNQGSTTAGGTFTIVPMSMNPPGSFSIAGGVLNYINDPDLFPLSVMIQYEVGDDECCTDGCTTDPSDDCYGVDVATVTIIGGNDAFLDLPEDDFCSDDEKLELFKYASIASVDLTGLTVDMDGVLEPGEVAFSVVAVNGSNTASALFVDVDGDGLFTAGIDFDYASVVDFSMCAAGDDLPGTPSTKPFDAMCAMLNFANIPKEVTLTIRMEYFNGTDTDGDGTVSPLEGCLSIAEDNIWVIPAGNAALMNDAVCIGTGTCGVQNRAVTANSFNFADLFYFDDPIFGTTTSCGYFSVSCPDDLTLGQGTDPNDTNGDGLFGPEDLDYPCYDYSHLIGNLNPHIATKLYITYTVGDPACTVDTQSAVVELCPQIEGFADPNLEIECTEGQPLNLANISFGPFTTQGGTWYGPYDPSTVPADLTNETPIAMPEMFDVLTIADGAPYVFVYAVDGTGACIGICPPSVSELTITVLEDLSQPERCHFFGDGSTFEPSSDLACNTTIMADNNTGINNLQSYPLRPGRTFSGPERIFELPLGSCGEVCFTIVDRTPSDQRVDLFILTDPTDPTSNVVWVNGLPGTTTCFTLNPGDSHYAVIDGIGPPEPFGINIATLEIEISCDQVCAETPVTYDILEDGYCSTDVGDALLLNRVCPETIVVGPVMSGMSCDVDTDFVPDFYDVDGDGSIDVYQNTSLSVQVAAAGTVYPNATINDDWYIQLIYFNQTDRLSDPGGPGGIGLPPPDISDTDCTTAPIDDALQTGDLSGGDHAGMIFSGTGLPYGNTGTPVMGSDFIVTNNDCPINGIFGAMAPTIFHEGTLPGGTYDPFTAPALLAGGNLNCTDPAGISGEEYFILQFTAKDIYAMYDDGDASNGDGKKDFLAAFFGNSCGAASEFVFSFGAMTTQEETDVFMVMDGMEIYNYKEDVAAINEHFQCPAAACPEPMDLGFTLTWIDQLCEDPDVAVDPTMIPAWMTPEMFMDALTFVTIPGTVPGFNDCYDVFLDINQLVPPACDLTTYEWEICHEIEICDLGCEQNNNLIEDVTFDANANGGDGLVFGCNGLNCNTPFGLNLNNNAIGILGHAEMIIPIVNPNPQPPFPITEACYTWPANTQISFNWLALGVNNTSPLGVPPALATGVGYTVGGVPTELFNNSTSQLTNPLDPLTANFGTTTVTVPANTPFCFYVEGGTVEILQLEADLVAIGTIFNEIIEDPAVYTYCKTFTTEREHVPNSDVACEADIDNFLQLGCIDSGKLYFDECKLYNFFEPYVITNDPGFPSDGDTDAGDDIICDVFGCDQTAPADPDAALGFWTVPQPFMDYIIQNGSEFAVLPGIWEAYEAGELGDGVTPYDVAFTPEQFDFDFDGVIDPLANCDYPASENSEKQLIIPVVYKLKACKDCESEKLYRYLHITKTPEVELALSNSPGICPSETSIVCLDEDCEWPNCTFDLILTNAQPIELVAADGVLDNVISGIPALPNDCDPENCVGLEPVFAPGITIIPDCGDGRPGIEIDWAVLTQANGFLDGFGEDLLGNFNLELIVYCGVGECDADGDGTFTSAYCSDSDDQDLFFLGESNADIEDYTACQVDVDLTNMFEPGPIATTGGGAFYIYTGDKADITINDTNVDDVISGTEVDVTNGFTTNVIPITGDVHTFIANNPSQDYVILYSIGATTTCAAYGCGILTITPSDGAIADWTFDTDPICVDDGIIDLDALLTALSVPNGVFTGDGVTLDPGADGVFGDDPFTPQDESLDDGAHPDYAFNPALVEFNGEKFVDVTICYEAVAGDGCEATRCNEVRVYNEADIQFGFPNNAATLECQDPNDGNGFIDIFDLSTLLTPASDQSGVWAIVTAPPVGVNGAGAAIFNDQLTGYPGCYELSYTVTCFEGADGACTDSEIFFLRMAEQASPAFDLAEEVCWDGVAGSLTLSTLYNGGTFGTNGTIVDLWTATLVSGPGPVPTFSSMTDQEPTVTIEGAGVFEICLTEEVTYPACGPMGPYDVDDCEVTVCHILDVTDTATAVTADWDPFGPVCADSPIVDLDELVNGDMNGVFTGTGVGPAAGGHPDYEFDPSMIDFKGQEFVDISICYTVGNDTDGSGDPSTVNNRILPGITDGAASWVYDNPNEVTGTSCDGNVSFDAGNGFDQAFGAEWYYSLNGGLSQIFPVPNPANIVQTAPNTLTVSYPDLGGNIGLDAVLMVIITENGPLDVQVAQLMQIQNNTGTNIDVSLFNYLDLDKVGNTTNDGTITLQDECNFITEVINPNEPDQPCYFAVNGANSYEVIAYPTLCNNLDAGVTNLSNTGLPLLGADHTQAYEFIGNIDDGDFVTGETLITFGTPPEAAVTDPVTGLCSFPSTPDPEPMEMVAGTGSGCDAVECHNIRVYAPVDATLEKLVFDCTIAPSGNISLDALFTDATTPGGTFSGTGVAGNTLQYDGPGCYEITYTVTAFDGATGECMDTGSGCILIPEQPQPSFDIQDQVCFSAGDVASHIYSPLVNSPSYDSDADNVATTWEIITGPATVAANGDVTVTGTGVIEVCMTETITTPGCVGQDDVICDETFCVQIQVNDGTAQDASFTIATQDLCPGDEVTLTAAENGGLFTGIGVTDNGVDPVLNVNTATVIVPANCEDVEATYTLNDPNGCTSSFTATIFADRIDPTFSTEPMDETVECGPNTDALLDTWLMNNAGAVAADNCDVSISSALLNTISGCGGTSESVYSFTATDECGNTATSLASFIIEDTTMPDIETTSNLTLDCSSISETSDPTLLIEDWLNTNFTASDICGNVVVTHDYDSAILDVCTESETLVTWTATDECGLTNTATATLFIDPDDTVPTFETTPEDLFLDCSDINETTAVTIEGWLNTVTISDDCDTDPVLTHNYTQETLDLCTAAGSPITVKWFATDACGNIDSVSAVLTITPDEAPPTFDTTPEDLFLDCSDINETTAVTIEGWLNSATISDVCDTDPVLTHDYTQETLDLCTAEGSPITVKWYATDACGNIDSVSAVLTITPDEAPPTFDTTPENLFLDCGEINETTAVTIEGWLNTVTISDICDTDPVLTNDFNTQTLDVCTAAGSPITVKWYATDACGNIDSVSAVLTITPDDAPPMFTEVPEDLFLDCGEINETTVVTIEGWLNSASIADACDTDPQLIHNYTQETLDLCTAAGSPITVKWFATDACGNIDSVSAVLTITPDTAPPTFDTTPEDLFLDCGEINETTAVTIEGWLNSATISDLCDTDPVLTHNYTQETLDLCTAEGSPITVKWYASDACGNIDSVSAVLTITPDDAPPIFDVFPSDLTLSCDQINENVAVTVEGWLNEVQIFDACDTDPVLTHNYTTQTLDVCSAAGSPITVKWFASDACGNIDSVSAVLTIVPDITPPVLSCTGLTTSGDAPFYDCEGDISWNHPLATDDCHVAIYTYTVTDPDGTINGPFDLTGALASGNLAGSFDFEEGVSIVSYYAEDDCGNDSECSFDVTVGDPVDPFFLDCPSDIFVGNDPDECSAKVNWEVPVAWDNCDIPANPDQIELDTSLVVSQLIGVHNGTTYDDIQSGQVISVGNYVIAYVVVDTDGNTDTCSFNLIVWDTQDPILMAGIPEDVTLSCEIQLDTFVMQPHHVMDNCVEDPTIENTLVSTRGMDPETCEYYSYQDTFFYTVTDSVQTLPDGSPKVNQMIWKWVVTWIDTTAPEVIPPPDFLIETCNYDVEIVESVVQVDSIQVDSLVAVGDDWVVLTVQLKKDTIVLDTIFTPIPIEDRMNGLPDVTDNCSPDSLFTLEKPFLSFRDDIEFLCKGDKTAIVHRWWIAEDPCGNIDSAEQLITILADPNPPVLEVNERDTVSLGPDGHVTLTRDDLVKSVFNACFSEETLINVEISPNYFNCSDIGVHTVLVSATDPCNNQTAYEFVEVLIIDNIAPVLNCPSGTIDLAINPRNCDGTFNEILDILVGNDCDVTITTDPPLNASLDMATDQITVIATDASGNSSSCVVDVTISLTEAIDFDEVLACNDRVNISLNSECWLELTPDQILEGSPDVCTELLCIEVEDPDGNDHLNFFDITDVGQLFRVRVVDCNGSGNSCWAEVLLEEKQIPDIVWPQDTSVLCVEPTDTSYFKIDVPQILNCEPVISFEFEDSYVEYDQCSTPRATITRAWTVTDDEGNVARDTQLIDIMPFSNDHVRFPKDITIEDPIDCKIVDETIDDIENNILDPTSHLHPDSTGLPNIFGLPLQTNAGLCLFSMGYEDRVLEICSGSYQIFRKWEINDVCSPYVEGVNPVSHTQVITIYDNDGPVLEEEHVPVNDTLSYNPWECAYSGPLKVPGGNIESCGDIFFEAYVTGGGYIVTEGTVGGGDLEIVAVGMEAGDHWITYVYTDGCNNISLYKYVITVVDEVAPVAICQGDISVTVTTDGVAKIYANDLDAGSHDAGCGPVNTCIVRMVDFEAGYLGVINGHSAYVAANSCHVDGEFRDTIFDKNSEIESISIIPFVLCQDELKICCTDLGDQTIVLQASDDVGLTSICMSQIIIDDKSSASLTCTPHAIDCTDDKDIDLLSPLGANRICGDEISLSYFDENEFIDGCGEGQIFRVWYLDSNDNGSLEDDEVSCNQVITVTNSASFDPYSLKWPKHYTGETFSGKNIECNEDNEVVELSVDVQMGAVFTCAATDPGDAPVWCNTSCGLVGLSTDIDTVTAGDACLKLIKRWTVIDWCYWEANGGSPSDDANDTEEDSFEAVEDWAQGVCAGCTENLADPVYFRYVDVDIDGYYTYDQVIKIVDDTDPTVITEDVVVNTSGGAASKDDETPCIGTGVVTAIASDQCGDDAISGELITWLITYDNGSESVVSRAEGTDVSIETQAGQPGDVHTVTFDVSDGCGNRSSTTSTVTFGDEKKPVPLCVAGVTTAFMESTGTVAVWAKDFDLGSFDNCSDVDFTVIHAGEPQDSAKANIVFDCDDLTQFYELDVWVTDANGNADFCTVGVLVGGTCDGSEGSAGALIAGQLSTEKGEMVEQATVTINSAQISEYPLSMLTLAVGEYAFPNNPKGFNYDVSVEKDGDYLNGVTTFDLVTMQKHIANIATFDSPYKVIAADVNNDQKVSVLDIIVLRNVILGLTRRFPNNTSWRFVDQSQTFVDIFNPWPFTEILTMPLLDEDKLTEDFIAVKIGDVTNDVIANSLSAAVTRTEDFIDFEIENAVLGEEETVLIPFSSSQFEEIVGFQFTLEHSGLTYDGIEAGALDIADQHVGVHEGAVAVSWESLQPISSAETLFTLRFKTNKSVELNQALQLNSSITKAEIYQGEDIELANLGLQIADEEAGLVELYQNDPNPFVDQTSIGFNLPEASEATLIIFTVDGQQVKRIEGDFVKGLNEVIISDTDIDVSGGLLYYQLQVGEFTATKKMMLVR